MGRWAGDLMGWTQARRQGKRAAREPTRDEARSGLSVCVCVCVCVCVWSLIQYKVKYAGRFSLFLAVYNRAAPMTEGEAVSAGVG